MERIYQEVRSQGKIEGKASSTIDKYIGSLGPFISWLGGQAPEQLSAQQLKMYLVQRVDVDEVSVNVLKSDVAAIKFLYAGVFGQPEKVRSSGKSGTMISRAWMWACTG